MIDADAFNEFEAGGWDQTAAGYDRFFAPITGRTIEDLLDAAAVGEGARLLDLASGPGYVAARAAARGAVPVGVDIAESMVALARGRHPELEFRRGDAEALPFEDESFDAAVGNFAILHLGRPERAVAELGRVLHPGGGVALTTWDRPERARLLGLVFDAVAATGAPAADVPEGPDVFRFSDDGEFAALLRDQGFEGIRVATIAFTHRVPSADALWEGMLEATVRTSALIVSQPPDVRDRIRTAFDRLAERHRSEDGSVEVPVSVKLASGVRSG